MHENEIPAAAAPKRIPWNRGKLIGPRPPLRQKHVWAIRTRLQLERQLRGLALFNLAIDSKLRGCDLVTIRVDDIAPSGYAVERASVRQRKTGRSVRFELSRWQPRRRNSHALIVRAGFDYRRRASTGRHLNHRRDSCPCRRGDRMRRREFITNRRCGSSSPDICRKCLRIMIIGSRGTLQRRSVFRAAVLATAARTSNVVCRASEGARWRFIVCIDFVTTGAFRGRRTLSIAATTMLQCRRRADYSKATCGRCGTSHASLGE